MYAVHTATRRLHVTVRSAASEGQLRFLNKAHVPLLGTLPYTVQVMDDPTALAAAAQRTERRLDLFLPLLLLALLCLGLEGWLANPLPRRAPDASAVTAPAAPSPTSKAPTQRVLKWLRTAVPGS